MAIDRQHFFDTCYTVIPRASKLEELRYGHRGQR